jgi:response regulator of citrate/malate metabolism
MDINLLNVLIIEDDPTVADLHKRFVESMEGFRVLAIAASGFKAMEIIKEKEVDVILLDIFLPEMDGIEFLKKIRVEGINAEVIAITAAQEGNIIQEMVHLGVFDYLLKPFLNCKVLINKIFLRIVLTRRLLTRYCKKMILFH